MLKATNADLWLCDQRHKNNRIRIQYSILKQQITDSLFVVFKFIYYGQFPNK
jgi:hypothetical protein